MAHIGWEKASWGIKGLGSMGKRACDRLGMVLDRWSISRDALRQQGRSRAHRSFMGKERGKGRKGRGVDTKLRVSVLDR